MVDCNQFLKVFILRLDMDRILLQIDFEFQFVRFFLKFLDPLLLFLISIEVIFCEFGRFTTCILFRCIRIRSVRPFQPPVNSYTSRDCCIAKRRSQQLQQKKKILWILATTISSSSPMNFSFFLIALDRCSFSARQQYLCNQSCNHKRATRKHTMRCSSCASYPTS